MGSTTTSQVNGKHVSNNTSIADPTWPRFDLQASDAGFQTQDASLAYMPARQSEPLDSAQLAPGDSFG